MSARLLLLCLVTLGLGCGKQRNPTPEGLPTASAPAGQGADAATGEAQLATLLGELTQAVRKYSVEQRAVPKTLDELVAKGYLPTAPQAPAGKRWVISKNLQVSLAD